MQRCHAVGDALPPCVKHWHVLPSATLWVYATLLLQLRVPNAMLGRVMAVEAAAYTLTQSTTALTGGLLFDLVGLSMRQVVVVNACLATVVTVRSNMTIATCGM